MRMDPKVKALWVEALRSGEFKRGLHHLRNLDEQYDPTGVLCELAVRAGVIEPAKRYDDSAHKRNWYGYMYGGPRDRQATGLPAAVSKWAGIHYHTGYRIAIMSDEGADFNEVADWIEENL